MFELSFGKLVILAAVVALVWFASRGGSRSAPRQPEAPRQRGAAPRVEAEDMIPCPVCGTYVTSKRPAACDRADCPYR